MSVAGGGGDGCAVCGRAERRRPSPADRRRRRRRARPGAPTGGRRLRGGGTAGVRVPDDLPWEARVVRDSDHWHPLCLPSDSFADWLHAGCARLTNPARPTGCVPPPPERPANRRRSHVPNSCCNSCCADVTRIGTRVGGRCCAGGRGRVRRPVRPPTRDSLLSWPVSCPAVLPVARQLASCRMPISCRQQSRQSTDRHSVGSQALRTALRRPTGRRPPRLPRAVRPARPRPRPRPRPGPGPGPGGATKGGGAAEGRRRPRALLVHGVPTHHPRLSKLSPPRPSQFGSPRQRSCFFFCRLGRHSAGRFPTLLTPGQQGETRSSGPFVKSRHPLSAAGGMSQRLPSGLPPPLAADAPAEPSRSPSGGGPGRRAALPEHRAVRESPIGSSAFRCVSTVHITAFRSAPAFSAATLSFRVLK